MDTISCRYQGVPCNICKHTPELFNLPCNYIKPYTSFFTITQLAQSLTDTLHLHVNASGQGINKVHVAYLCIRKMATGAVNRNRIQ